jgi:hypothetical protein
MQRKTLARALAVTTANPVSLDLLISSSFHSRAGAFSSRRGEGMCWLGGIIIASASTPLVPSE